MKSVDIVSAHDIGCHTTSIVGCLLQTGVEQHQIIIRETELWMLHHHTTGSQLSHRSSSVLGAIRIDPGMQFHASTMTLLHHPLQRVPIRRRSFSLLSCQISAPRFQLAFIESIALCPHLKNNGIDTILLQFIELAAKHVLYLFCRLSQILSVHTLYPHATKLSLVLSLHCTSLQQESNHDCYCKDCL